MQATNIILGYGETLTMGHSLNKGGGSKKYPYLIEEQRNWLGKQLSELLVATGALPVAARPRGEAVVKITLHPTFLAKSHHPNALFAAASLRCIGSRSTVVTPRKEVRKNAKLEPTFTAELFVAGRDTSFKKLAELLKSPSTGKGLQDALRRLELIKPYAAAEKNQLPDTLGNKVRLEVVLHASAADKDIVQAFGTFAASLGGQVDLENALVVSGLCFVPVVLPVTQVDSLGDFQFVRFIRQMPVLRIGGGEVRSLGPSKAKLPTLAALDQNLKVGVFDGGIGHTSFAPWVAEIELQGTSKTSAPYLGHGNNVTSAVLFGPLDPASNEFPRPYANVQHYRCIGPDLLVGNGVPDINLYGVLKNIDQVLSTTKLDFANFSLGPHMPIEDDEVHSWTALIDQHLASGKIFATVAVGNDGDKPWPDSRVQPPSDMVNALAIGACDSRGSDWKRASYSSHGPGRSPGLVKPDGVAFGGSGIEPFVTYDAFSNELKGVTGTSFSSPFALHTAIGVKAALNSPLNMLALRALMNHHAYRPKDVKMHEVGFGRFPQEVADVLHCDDNEVRVIYQGTLEAGQNLRALIPFPTMRLQGRVTLRATLCFASQTDPEHAVNYTRAGLTVHLRPNKNVADTMTFFSSSKMYPTELEARMDNHKWETTLKHEHRFNAETLNDPLFDITYGAREDGQAVDNSTLAPLPYAMVVTVSVENTPGIYNNIRQRYQTLQPVEVRQEVRLKAGGLAD